MTEKQPPEIKKISSGSDYTCITFKPDLNRFKMDNMDPDIVALLSKRVYDIAATTVCTNGPKLSVTLNGTKIETKFSKRWRWLSSKYKSLENRLN